MPDAVVVVPCFNEAQRLEPDRFIDALARDPRVSYRFVDDGSRDATFEVLEAMAARAPARIVAQRLATNAGKGEAVRAGLCAAIEGGAVYVGFWDADLATPLSEVRRFVDRLESSPDIRVVLGSRVKMLGRTIDRRTRRHLIGRAFATVIATTLNMPVYDTQCGAKLFRVDDDLEEALAEPFRARWVFDVELLARLRDAYVRRGIDPLAAMREEPLHEWHDVVGSKIKARDGVIALVDLYGIRRRYPST